MERLPDRLGRDLFWREPRGITHRRQASERPPTRRQAKVAGTLAQPTFELGQRRALQPLWGTLGALGLGLQARQPFLREGPNEAADGLITPAQLGLDLPRR